MPWIEPKRQKGTAHTHKKKPKSAQPTINHKIDKKPQIPEIVKEKKNRISTEKKESPGKEKTKQRLQVQMNRLKKRTNTPLNIVVSAVAASPVQNASQIASLQQHNQQLTQQVNMQHTLIETLQKEALEDGSGSKAKLLAAEQLIATLQKESQQKNKHIKTLEKNAEQKTEKGSGSASLPTLKRKHTKPVPNPTTTPTKKVDTTPTKTTKPKTTTETPKTTANQLSAPTKAPPDTPTWEGWGSGKFDKEMKVLEQNPASVPVTIPKPKGNRTRSRLTDGVKSKPNPHSTDPLPTFGEDAVKKQFVVKLDDHRHPLLVTLFKLVEYKGVMGGAGWCYTKKPDRAWLLPSTFCRVVHTAPKNKKP